MAPIPPAVWIGVGAVISAVSLLRESLLLFIVPGVAFIIWGAAKAIRGNTDKARAPEHTYNTKPKQAGGAKRCFVCNAKNSAQANYCGHCGHKLT